MYKELHFLSMLGFTSAAPALSNKAEPSVSFGLCLPSEWELALAILSELEEMW